MLIPIFSLVSLCVVSATYDSNPPAPPASDPAPSYPANNAPSAASPIVQQIISQAKPTYNIPAHANVRSGKNHGPFQDVFKGSRSHSSSHDSDSYDSDDSRDHRHRRSRHGRRYESAYGDMPVYPVYHGYQYHYPPYPYHSGYVSSPYFTEKKSQRHGRRHSRSSSYSDED